MTGEIRNYFRRCLSPFFALQAAYFFASRAWWSLSARMYPASRHSFPQAIAALRRELSSRDETASMDGEAPQPLPKRPLTLVAASFTVEHESDWLHEFSDIEVTVSLHRWNWLLRGLTDDPAVLSREQGESLMRSWVRVCLNRPELDSDAYSTGERIVNGSLFLLLTGDNRIPPDLISAFRRMGRQVAMHLEYYRAGQTGNHAFNNARALFFAGVLAQLAGAVELALAIAKERLPKLVTDEGFMREGSSHYHFLFTRWVLEMLWLARRVDERRFVQLLEPYAAALVKRCWFFLVQRGAQGEWRMPLFGDVSPDFPPDWLIGLPWSAFACEVYAPDGMPQPPTMRGWCDLFGVVAGRGALAKRMDGNFPRSGWVRADESDWTVFVRAASDDGEVEASHAHHDLGSFVVFCKGMPLLVDCGRLDYTGSPLSLYGRSASAHNTLLVDGLSAICEGPAWFAGQYRSVSVCVQMTREGGRTSITIQHDGFARLAGAAVSHRRCFTLDRHSLAIEDRLQGDGVRCVQLRFHFAPGIFLRQDTNGHWRLRDFAAVLSADGRLQGRVQAADAGADPGGLFFPAYGCQVASETFESAGTVRLPVTLTHVLLRES